MHPTTQHEPSIRVFNVQPGDLVQFAEICRMGSLAAEARDRVVRIDRFPGSPDLAVRAVRELLDTGQRSTAELRKLLAEAHTRIARQQDPDRRQARLALLADFDRIRTDAGAIWKSQRKLLTLGHLLAELASSTRVSALLAAGVCGAPLLRATARAVRDASVAATRVWHDRAIDIIGAAEPRLARCCAPPRLIRPAGARRLCWEFPCTAVPLVRSPGS